MSVSMRDLDPTFKGVGQKAGVLRHDILYWLVKDTSQIVELDAALRGRVIQYREVQGHETEKFLSYFKPCIIPQQGGAASGFKHDEAEEHKTTSKIFQFNGSNSSIQERGKALEVGCFRGFAPLPRRIVSYDDKPADSHPPKLLCVDKGKAEPIETDSLTKEFLDTNKCYILDCGLEFFAWMGRNTS
ncbi:hypothetical protein JHK82_048086 [Glycine max]|nr:hypothetical protein JHK82_048086 [Glycine max]